MHSTVVAETTTRGGGHHVARHRAMPLARGHGDREYWPSAELSKRGGGSVAERGSRSTTSGDGRHVDSHRARPLARGDGDHEY